MKHSERDESTIRHIIRYCDEIADAISRHDLSLEKVTADHVYKNALSIYSSLGQEKESGEVRQSMEKLTDSNGEKDEKS